MRWVYPYAPELESGATCAYRPFIPFAHLARRSVQILLDHASIQTTELSLGTAQNLTIAVNDAIGLERNQGSGWIVEERSGTEKQRLDRMKLGRRMLALFSQRLRKRAHA